MSYLNGLVVFPAFFNLSLNLAIRSSWSEPQSTPGLRSCFCWLYRASPSLAAKNIINLISVLTIWWCPCVESSLVLLKEGNAKECSNYCTIALISHASKVMLKILQARLQQYANHELPDVQLILEKAEEPEIKLPTSAGSWKKQESSRKTSISALLTMPKPLTVWITINCGKFWERWEYQTTWTASWETCMQVRKQ